MSTHALVFGESSLGRYVHFDGYPSGVGAALLRIVQRDGLDVARKVVLDSQGGWVSLHGEPSRSEYDEDGKLFKNIFNAEPGTVVDFGDTSHPFVVGYGDADVYGDPVNSDDLSDAPSCAWAYHLGDAGLNFARLDENPKIKWLGVARWDTRPEDLMDIVELSHSLFG